MIGLSRIQRYILKENAQTLAVVLAVVMMAVLLIDTVEQLNTIGSRVRLSLADAFGLSLYKLPALIERTLAFALLIASMLTFRQLSQRAELPVIRATGLSAWSFLTPIAVLAFLVGIFTTTVLSPYGANLTEAYEAKRSVLLGNEASSENLEQNEIWLRDGDERTQTVIHAASFDDTNGYFSAVTFLQEERDLTAPADTSTYRFARRLEANSARLVDNRWELQDVIEYAPDQTITTYATLTFPTTLRPDNLTDRKTAPANISFWELPAHIAEKEQIGLGATRLKMRWFSLTALPIMFVAMSLIGAIACLRLIRLGGTAPFIAFGTASAIVLFFVTQLGSSFGTIGAIPPIVAAWAPPLSALLICLAFLAFREDG